MRTTKTAMLLTRKSQHFFNKSIPPVLILGQKDIKKHPSARTERCAYLQTSRRADIYRKKTRLLPCRHTMMSNPSCLGLNQIQADNESISRHKKKYNSHCVMLSFASAVSYHIYASHAMVPAKSEKGGDSSIKSLYFSSFYLIILPILVTRCSLVRN